MKLFFYLFEIIDKCRQACSDVGTTLLFDSSKCLGDGEVNGRYKIV